uniref:Uncharacterized protein n=1 Tax=Romanomermis culicivorax TaxID=13658 RepID=A0A915K153_ROMCU
MSINANIYDWRMLRSFDLRRREIIDAAAASPSTSAALADGTAVNVGNFTAVEAAGSPAVGDLFTNRRFSTEGEPTDKPYRSDLLGEATGAEIKYKAISYNGRQ